jgi:hypothetical protein
VKKRSRPALLLGGHLGYAVPGGNLPVTASQTTDFGSAATPGVAFAFDGGVRFGRQFYLGVTAERVNLGGAKSAGDFQVGASSMTSNATAAGVVLGVIVNPEKMSFFGELGLQGRWFNLSFTDRNNINQSANYSGAEVLIGAGLWLPTGSPFRLLPLLTGGFGPFSAPNTDASQSNSQYHTFVMVGIAGFLNVNL